MAYNIPVLKKQSELFLSRSAQETIKFGQALALRFREDYGRRPVIFRLLGELGVGKTQLVKGLAAGLNIKDLITSPSYTLVNEYHFDLTDLSDHQQLKDKKFIPFIHIDAWRLTKPAAFKQIGWEKYLSQLAVIALEWPPQNLSLLPGKLDQAKIISIKLNYQNQTETREIFIETN